MTRPRIKIGLEATEHGNVLTQAILNVNSMTANPNFPGTINPPLADITTAATALSAAITARGSIHVHGSTAAVNDCNTKSRDLLLMLKTLAAYVTSVASALAGVDNNLMASVMESAGFSLQRAKNPQAQFDAVQNFRVAPQGSLNPWQAKLQWSSPANCTSPGNLKLYKLWRGINPPVFSTAAIWTTTSKSELLISNETGGPQTWIFWCAAVSAESDGQVSLPLVITLISA